MLIQLLGSCWPISKWHMRPTLHLSVIWWRPIRCPHPPPALCPCLPMCWLAPSCTENWIPTQLWSHLFTEKTQTTTIFPDSRIFSFPCIRITQPAPLQQRTKNGLRCKGNFDKWYIFGQSSLLLSCFVLRCVIPWTEMPKKLKETFRSQSLRVDLDSFCRKLQGFGSCSVRLPPPKCHVASAQFLPEVVLTRTL